MNTGPPDLDSHRLAIGMIPWYVNGTLAAAEVATLTAHLHECTRCQAEYQAQLRLHESMQSDDTLVFAAEPSFRKLMARINTAADAGVLATEGAAAPAPAAPVRRYAARGVARWLTAAVVLEGLGLGYGAWAWHSQVTGAAPAPAYVTLTNPQASYRDSPRVRIVFRSGLSVHGLGVLLHQMDAHIIDGPTDSNVYTLGFANSGVTADVLEQRVGALRANADVLFAEPLGASTDVR